MTDSEKIEALLSISYKEFMAELRSEVDKANKRLKRMNDFQKGIFARKDFDAHSFHRRRCNSRAEPTNPQQYPSDPLLCVVLF